MVNLRYFENKIFISKRIRVNLYSALINFSVPAFFYRYNRVIGTLEIKYIVFANDIYTIVIDFKRVIDLNNNYNVASRNCHSHAQDCCFELYFWFEVVNVVTRHIFLVACNLTSNFGCQQAKVRRDTRKRNLCLLFTPQVPVTPA